MQDINNNENILNEKIIQCNNYITNDTKNAIIIGAIPEENSHFILTDIDKVIYVTNIEGYPNISTIIQKYTELTIEEYPLLITNITYLTSRLQNKYDVIISDSGTMYWNTIDKLFILNLFKLIKNNDSIILFDNLSNINPLKSFVISDIISIFSNTNLHDKLSCYYFKMLHSIIHKMIIIDYIVTWIRFNFPKLAHDIIESNPYWSVDKPYIFIKISKILDYIPDIETDIPAIFICKPVIDYLKLVSESKLHTISPNEWKDIIQNINPEDMNYIVELSITYDKVIQGILLLSTMDWIYIIKKTSNISLFDNIRKISSLLDTELNIKESNELAKSIKSIHVAEKS
jgi:hypothetical protein